MRKPRKIPAISGNFSSVFDKRKQKQFAVFWLTDEVYFFTVKFTMFENAALEDMRSKAVAAAEAVYRLSRPEGFDPALKFELRKYATKILGRLSGLTIASSYSRDDDYGLYELRAYIAGIKELISFAAERGFIAIKNAELVIGAYNRVGGILANPQDTLKDGDDVFAEEKRLPSVQNGAVSMENIGGDLNERQRKILEYVAIHDQAHISVIRGLFSESCSEKTLQRDLWQLVDSGLIRRQGGNRWTTYSLSTLSKSVSRFLKNNVRDMS